MNGYQYYSAGLLLPVDKYPEIKKSVTSTAPTSTSTRSKMNLRPKQKKHAVTDGGQKTATPTPDPVASRVRFSVCVSISFWYMNMYCSVHVCVSLYQYVLLIFNTMVCLMIIMLLSVTYSDEKVNGIVFWSWLLWMLASLTWFTIQLC